MEREDPWKTLARIAGPLMIWLSLSFILLTMLLDNQWIRDSLQEVEPVSTLSLLLRGAVCAGIGIVLVAWGYSGRSAACVPAQAHAGSYVCSNCGAELLVTTPKCPFCGKESVR